MIVDGLSGESKTVTSFLMLGQSNMAGRGNLSQVAPLENDKCFMLRNGRWQKMSEPVNPDRGILNGEFTSGVSLATSFADAYANHTKENVGLIPCADGGTNISQWQSDGVLFEHAVFQAKLAMRTSQLKCVLWHQGESDCNSDEDVASYAKRFLTMVHDLRSALEVPSLPFIIGELSEEISSKWKMDGRNKLLNEQLKNLTQNNELLYLVSAKDLKLNPDGIHFDAESCRTFGCRYFSTLLKYL